jgi:CRISPR/Cas system-associated exonuclease Cas4 (RecB family)
VTTLYRQEEGEEEVYNQLYRESLFKTYTLVGRLHTLMEEGVLSVLTATFKRLLSELLTAATIPFHGEPAVGVQVMGVLETRNLDFRRLLMLSVNEGQLPRAGGDASFIPYNLRKAFGMTTIEHKNAVYAYYFYRLIQRAEEITLLYNTSAEGLNRGEMSRFMLQLLVETPHEVVQQHIEAGQEPQEGGAAAVAKTEEMIARLYERYDTGRHPEAVLSPSALNTYLDCRLRFYYRYVAGLKVPDEVSADIDSALFGTIFHRAAQLAYEQLTADGREVRREELERLLRDGVRLERFVDRAFKEHFFHIGEKERSAYNGTQLINAKVIQQYLRQLLQTDLAYAPFRMQAMEEPVRETMEVETPLGRLTLNVGGTIDRMDIKEDTLRIVDYKTGGTPKTAESIGQLFEPGEERPGYVFQTFLYAAIMCRKQTLKVAPALLYIHRAAAESYSPVIEMGAPRQPKTPVLNFAFYEEEFRTRLLALLGELFDPAEAFEPTADVAKCAYCDFRKLCRR